MANVSLIGSQQQGPLARPIFVPSPEARLLQKTQQNEQGPLQMMKAFQGLKTPQTLQKPIPVGLGADTADLSWMGPSAGKAVLPNLQVPVFGAAEGAGALATGAPEAAALAPEILQQLIALGPLLI